MDINQSTCSRSRNCFKAKENYDLNHCTESSFKKPLCNFRNMLTKRPHLQYPSTTFMQTYSTVPRANHDLLLQRSPLDAPPMPSAIIPAAHASAYANVERVRRHEVRK